MVLPARTGSQGEKRASLPMFSVGFYTATKSCVTNTVPDDVWQSYEQLVLLLF